MSTSAIIFAIVIVAFLYFIFHKINTPKSSTEYKQSAENAEVDEPTQRAVMIDHINTTLRATEILSKVAPISHQMRSGMGGRKAPEGGIFDPYVRGYLLGYINSLIETANAGGVDASPHMALEIFGVMYGAGYGDDETGIEVFQECLSERSKSDNDGKDTPFAHGFSSGATDHKKFHSGQQPDSLSKYIEVKFASL